MKTNATRLITGLMAIALLFSCHPSVGQTGRKTTVRGSRNLVTRTLKVGKFTKIDASGMYNIDFYQVEDNPRIEITTSDNIMEFVEAETRGSVLNLGLSEKHRYDIKKIRLKVYAPELEGLVVRGTADVSLTHGLMTRVLDIEVNGAGNIRMEDIDVTGDAKIEINGAGDLNATKISAGNLTVQVDGAGDVDVHDIDSETVTVVIRGAGNAVLSGEVKTAILKVSGVGSINATQLEAENFEINKSGIGSIKR